MIYYKAKLWAQEEGLQVFIEEWHSVKETACIHFCVVKHQLGAHGLNLPVQKKRVYKNGSRFAQDSVEKAINHLVMMKNRQLVHMNREKAFINSFLSKSSELEKDYHSSDLFNVPDTRDLVHEHLAFD